MDERQGRVRKRQPFTVSVKTCLGADTVRATARWHQVETSALRPAALVNERSAIPARIWHPKQLGKQGLRSTLAMHTHTMPMRNYCAAGTASGQGAAHRSLRGGLCHFGLPDPPLGQQLRAPVTDQVRAVEVQAARLHIAAQWCSPPARTMPRHAEQPQWKGSKPKAGLRVGRASRVLIVRMKPAQELRRAPPDDPTHVQELTQPFASGPAMPLHCLLAVKG